MGDLTNLLLNGIVEFPTSIPASAPWPLGWFPFIGHFVYNIISAMYGGGAVSYGVAIILFTIILKLILLPMDFLNKYFTKKNSNFMQKIKPEEDELKEQYAADPIQLNRARSALYKKHGYKMGGFCLFMFINILVIAMVFFTVFGALRFVADHNIREQARAVQGVYLEFYQTDPIFDREGQEFIDAINTAYNQHNVGFLWIQNVWVPDVPWSSSSTLSRTLYHRIGTTPEGFTAEQSAAMLNSQYDAISAAINPSNNRDWNGLLILIILAGVTSWGSAYVNSKMMLKNRKKDDKPKEPKIEYSMRNTKDRSEVKVPTVDPVMMGRIMKIVLPIIMVYFTMISTAALAIYIIMNSVLSTAILFGLNYPVDKLLAWEEKRKKARGDAPPDVEPGTINPHTKYFKNKRKKP